MLWQERLTDLSLSLEPEENLQESAELLHRFWEHVGGLHLKKGNHSHVYVAKKAWISTRPILVHRHSSFRSFTKIDLLPLTNRTGNKGFPS